MHRFLGRQKIINQLGHKTILGPSAQGWFCVLRWNEFFKGVTDYMVKHNISKDGDVLAADYVMADWEINLRKALKQAFPRVEIKGW